MLGTKLLRETRSAPIDPKSTGSPQRAGASQSVRCRSHAGRAQGSLTRRSFWKGTLKVDLILQTGHRQEVVDRWDAVKCIRCICVKWFCLVQKWNTASVGVWNCAQSGMNTDEKTSWKSIWRRIHHPLPLSDRLVAQFSWQVKTMID